jgi:hemerythrin-like domain-containing protein
MKATEQLMKEHEAVIQMLHILGSVKNKLSSGQDVPAEDMESMVDFLRVFVDKCHHGKEENLLFPKLVEIGIPNEGGPVGVMLAEHVQGRGYIKSFADGIEMHKEGDPAGRYQIIRNITGYSELLENHIHKENNILFHMADMHLEERDQEALFRQFEELEENVIGPAKHEEYHKLLDVLSNRYQG